MPGSADCGVILDRLTPDRDSDCSGNWDEPHPAERRENDTQNANGSKAHRAKTIDGRLDGLDFIWPSHGRMTEPASPLVVLELELGLGGG